jgi:hypothetical protein
MIKLTQILNESESNLSYLDNKVYRKYLNVFNTKYPELQNQVKRYVYPEWGDMIFNESVSYSSITTFFGIGFFNLDKEEISDLVFLYILNLDVKNFLTEELNVGNGLYLVTMEMAEEGFDYYSETESVSCDDCHGRGSETETCTSCGGSGQIEDSDGETETCDECDGTGEVEVECDYCGGAGEYDEDTNSVTKTINKWFMIMTEKPDFPKIDNGGDFIEKYGDKVFMITGARSEEQTSEWENNLPDDLEILDWDVDVINKFSIRYMI